MNIEIKLVSIRLKPSEVDECNEILAEACMKIDAKLREREDVMWEVVSTGRKANYI